MTVYICDLKCVVLSLVEEAFQVEGCEKTFLWIVILQLEGWPGQSQSQREAHYDEDAALDFSSIVLADQSWVFRPRKNGRERRCDRSREDQGLVAS